MPIVVPCGRSASSPTLHSIVMMLRDLAQLFTFTRFPFMSGKVCTKVPGKKVSHNEEDEDELPPGDTERYQARVARANYLATYRSDIHFAVKELARGMSCPTRGSWKALVQSEKYLNAHHRRSLSCKHQDLPKEPHGRTQTSRDARQPIGARRECLCRTKDRIHHTL